MKLIRFIKSKTFWANVLLAVVACALVFFAVSYILDSYTRHGENITVPDLTRLSYDEAATKLAEMDLEPEILDSAEFTSAYPRGSIIDQYPMPGSLVKVNRKIQLTINPMKPKKIELPQLVDKTKRRAIYDLESKGFVVGKLSYVPYIGKDVVVSVEVNGRSVKEKDRFDKGTVVDLILGQGLENTKIPMPYVKFLTLAGARDKLLASSLNIGSVKYDEEVTDTATAVVYQQYPRPGLVPNVFVGAEVDLWLTNDYTKIPNDSLQFLHPELDTTFTDNVETGDPDETYTPDQ